MGIADKVKAAADMKPSKKVEPKAVDKAPEHVTPSIPMRVIAPKKVQKHDPAEVRQMECYINMLGAAHANDALRLFHRIINS